MRNEKIDCPLVFPTGCHQSLKSSQYNSKHCSLLSTDCLGAQAAGETQSEQTKLKVLVSLKRNFPVELTVMTEPSSPQG